MQIVTPLRKTILFAAIFLMLVVSAPRKAQAASKEIIELQTQVQQLLDRVQQLQSTMDQRFAVLQHLAEQTTDNANRVTAAVSTLQQKLAAQQDGAGGKLDTVSGQVQSLNDSIDELKTRINKLDKAIQDMQTQMQQAQPAAPAAISAAPATADGSAPSALPTTAPAASQAPPLQDAFQVALRDYNAAKYDLATSEFQDVIRYYPTDDMAGQAHFYLGEIAFHAQRYSDAVKAYNAVLEGFSGSPRAAAAQLHKGFAMLQMKDRRDAGIHELRLLIQRHPQTPEADKAREKLNALGVKIR
jgi:TolA-binding protein